jgi:hypothetical protein
MSGLGLPGWEQTREQRYLIPLCRRVGVALVSAQPAEGDLFYCVWTVSFWGVKVAEETETAISISIRMVWKEARTLLVVQEVMRTRCLHARKKQWLLETSATIWSRQKT